MAAESPEQDMAPVVPKSSAPPAKDVEGGGVAGRPAQPDDRESDILAKVVHVELGDGILGIKMNPLVTILSASLIWFFILLTVSMPDRMNHALGEVAFDWIPRVWTWLYIVSQDIWIFVLVYLCLVPKYANLKLGRDDEEAEYSFATWFSMLFSAGVAVGLFYYGVAEPLWHYEGDGGPRWSRNDKGYGNSNEDAIHGIMVTWYHWGLHGWIAYTTMGAVLAIMTYRRGYPLTIRYCMWPLLGDKAYGFMGDIVDTLSIMTTLFGVCTSLGLGAMQLNQGLQRLNHGFFRGTNHAISDDPKYANPTCDGTGETCGPGEESYGIQINVFTQILIILFITCMATLSVVSGLGQGIKNLSRCNFALGMFVLLMVLFMGETYFCLDVIVQTLGYYIFYFFKIGFHTDAFERLGSMSFGLGGAPDELGGGSTWLSSWTIFYWGWWISWAPFMGTFLARISRGRTLRQFIVGTVFLPSIYSFFWFGIFGAEGIRMQRLADGSGLCDAAYLNNQSLCTGGPDSGGSRISGKCVAYSAQYSYEYKQQVGMGWNATCVLDPDYHDGYGRCKQFEWTRNVVVGDVCTRSSEWVDIPCGGMADPTAGSVPSEGPCSHQGNWFDFDHYPPNQQQSCFVPLQDGVVCLYNQGTTDILFDLLASYTPRGFSDFMAVMTMIALTLYFVTSSDSGSFVIDMIASNGVKNPPIAQRIFWSVTEGVTASALLAAGRNRPDEEGSLRALQSCSLIMGLPYTFVLFWCTQSLVILCKEESGEIDVDRKAFNSYIFEIFPIGERPVMLVKNIFAPGVGIGRIIAQVGGWPQLLPRSQAISGMVWGALLQVMYLVAIICCWCGFALYAWLVMGLVLYLGFGSLLGFLRGQVRDVHGIKHGDLITDLICGIFAMPFAVTQMECQMGGPNKVAIHPSFSTW
mmetsp:Transcript_57333/g.134407  ORF Transcript_57333/g.134407 Transcript_57333/m.134407 type:complete len:917 (-) Transcript_57333:164-2914(-)